MNNPAHGKLQVPWYVHLYVWTFMIVLGISPVLYILGTRQAMQPSEVLGALTAVLLIQILLWVAQALCSSEELSYWEGLLIAAACMRTGIAPISLALSFCALLLTVGASFGFALIHDVRHPPRHASIRFSKLIIAIHRRRLYR